MKTILKYIAVIILLTIIVSEVFSQNEQWNTTLSAERQNYDGPKAKYVFYFIGDGMGLAHVTLAEYFKSAMVGKISYEPLMMNTFPVYGMTTNYAKTRFITGSAASATALATGHKTHINGISYDSISKESLETIAEIAHKEGMKVGIITTVQMNDATPASFYAHAKSRKEYENISEQLVKSNFDFFGGGGVKSSPAKNYDIKGELKKAGYTVIDNNKKFKEFDQKDKKLYYFAETPNQDSSMPYMIDQESTVTLADITEKAIQLLTNPEGFFLMVEGGKIDWAAHANDAATVIKEIYGFDDAIKIAMEFYKHHPDETLIVVTSDHETGGLSLGVKNMQYESNYPLLAAQKHSSDRMKTIIKNYLQNTNQSDLNIEDQALELGNQLGITKEIIRNNPNIKETIIKVYTEQKDRFNKSSEIDYWEFAGQYSKIFNDFSGIGFSTNQHSSSPIPLRAIGVGSELFDGFYDNTDIPKNILKIMN